MTMGIPTDFTIAKTNIIFWGLFARPIWQSIQFCFAFQFSCELARP